MALQNAVVAVLVEDAAHSVQITDPDPAKEPQTITPPPPCLRFDVTHCGIILSPTGLRTKMLCDEPKF